jgi:hypothetical protein
MEDLLAALEDADRALGWSAAHAVDERCLEGVPDAVVLQVGALAAAIARRAEAVLVAVAEQVDERCDTSYADEKLCHRMGCRTPDELLRRVTRSSGRTVAGLRATARALARPLLPSSGERRECDYPAIRRALAQGHVGVDGAAAMLRPLQAMGGRAGWEAVAAADEELAAAASGEGADAAPPADADELRDIARVWAAYLDQDGAEPREARALRTRGVTLGVARDGVVPIRGNLLPEVAGQLTRLFDALLNPKVAPPPAPVLTGESHPPAEPSRGPFFTETPDRDDGPDADAPPDPRSRPQRMHDALASIFSVAARASDMPTLGGAAPTLIVTAIADDLASVDGWAHVTGIDEPVPLSVARQVACTGAIHRVTHSPDGRILSLGVSDRVFTAAQRRALHARDGGCIIPGCHIPADWCEIHHVVEHSRGGPTHTDNGVLLCWFHHRTIDSGPWTIRMRDGVPEVRGPTWWDPARRWRPTTDSPTRRRHRLRQRRPDRDRERERVASG